MRFDTIVRCFALVLAPALVLGGCAREAGTDDHAAVAAAAAKPRPKPADLAVATFAGGCFWCVETQFEGVPGVHSVVSGFTGGHTENPTYDQVTAGGTGHYESVRIEYDPKRVTYAQLLDRFWYGIDPTQADGQFCDRGDSYRSAIFVHDAEQRRLAESTKQRIERSGVLKGKAIVTEILAAAAFYPAEEYHQDFWKKDPVRYRTYRLGCGRDRRLQQLWGKLAVKPSAH